MCITDVRAVPILFSLRDRLSLGKRYQFGFWICPLLTWFFVGAEFLLILNGSPTIDRWLSGTLFWITSAIWCAFWGGLSLFSGFAATFFWQDFEGNKNTFWSFALAWVPYFMWFSCVALPFFLLFFGFYQLGLWVGDKFWQSNMSRQFYGDFSDASKSSKLTPKMNDSIQK